MTATQTRTAPISALDMPVSGCVLAVLMISVP